MKPYFCEDILDSRTSLPIFLHDKKPPDMCPLSGQMILDSIGERGYVVSFFAVKSGCKLTLERKEDGLGEGTADIIRLMWAVSIHGASEVSVTKRTHMIAVPVANSS